MGFENVENWYPKTFSEKIDYILLYLNNHIKYMGESIKLKKEALFSAFLIERYDTDVYGMSDKRSKEEMKKQADYIINYLINSKLIFSPSSWNGGEYERPITLSPDGAERHGG